MALKGTGHRLVRGNSARVARLQKHQCLKISCKTSALLPPISVLYIPKEIFYSRDGMRYISIRICQSARLHPVFPCAAYGQCSYMLNCPSILIAQSWLNIQTLMISLLWKTTHAINSLVPQQADPGVIAAPATGKLDNIFYNGKLQVKGG